MSLFDTILRGIEIGMSANAGRSNLSDMGYNNQVRHGYKDPNTGFLTEKGVARMTAVDQVRAQDHLDSMKE